jgi:hypothetical protein
MTPYLRYSYTASLYLEPIIPLVCTSFRMTVYPGLLIFVPSFTLEIMNKDEEWCLLGCYVVWLL